MKDLWTRVWQTRQVFIYTQLYPPDNFICAERVSFGSYFPAPQIVTDDTQKSIESMAVQ